jgi:hypothetical protein
VDGIGFGGNNTRVIHAVALIPRSAAILAASIWQAKLGIMVCIEMPAGSRRSQSEFVSMNNPSILYLYCYVVNKAPKKSGRVHPDKFAALLIGQALAVGPRLLAWELLPNCCYHDLDRI